MPTLEKFAGLYEYLQDREIVVEDTTEGAPDDLRHYTAAIRTDRWIMAGNGTQVSELAAAEPNFSATSRTLTYEPTLPMSR